MPSYIARLINDMFIFFLLAEVLFKVRNDFTERATKPVIKQLLGDLLTEKILNDMESESIEEEYTARADKAKALIDTVRKKGDAASERMIAHLKRRDPALYTTLGLDYAVPMGEWT